MAMVDERPMTPAAIFPLSPDASAVPAARQFTRGVLEAWGLSHLVDDAFVCVSELVTNALLHTRGPAELRLHRRGRVVRIEVVDGTPVPPEQLRHFAAAEAAYAGSEAQTGRGLLLVSRFASRWGAEACRTSGGNDGKAVWAEVGA